MQILPIPFRFALLCLLALMVSRSSLQADCSGDHYWDADPEGTLTWYPRGAEIPIRLPLSRALEVIQHALQNAGVPSCDAQKDLVGQHVKVVRAFRSDTKQTRIPAGFNVHQDYSQVMVRIINRGANDYAAQILTRSKWGQGREQPSEKADQYERCAALTIAEKVRANLVPLTAAR